MAPLLIPIVSMLAEKGLNLISKAMDSGEEKVVELVKEKTGIDLTTKKEIDKEDELSLKKFEADYELELLRLALAEKQEDNRHSETLYTTAHNTYNQDNDMSDKIANQIISWNLVIIGILVLANVAIVYFMQENPNLIAIVSQIIGIAIGNLFAERQAIVNFFYGSSLGSKIKDLDFYKKGASNAK